MILARCPACSTTFRVRPEQLNARQGRVRCGQCQHAFNALENQVEEEALGEELPAPPQPATPSGSETSDAPLFVLQEKQPEAATTAAGDNDAQQDADADAELIAPPQADAASRPLDDIPATSDTAAPSVLAEFSSAVDSFPGAPDFIGLDELEPPPHSPAALPEVVDERIEPSGEIPSAALDAWSEPLEAVTPLTTDETAPEDTAPPADDAHEAAPAALAPASFAPDWPDASELDLKPPEAPLAKAAPEEEPLDFDSLLYKKVVDDTPGTPQKALDDGVPATSAIAAAPPVGLPIEVPPTSASGSEPEDEQDDGEAVTEELEVPGGPSALQQVIWAAGATLLLLALLAQGVLVFRSEIAQSSPQMRLFMESVCAGMGCELPLPRESGSITIESSDIQPDANREASFTLHATLRNRAEFAQAWPHMEITLTDARDKPLVRRVLEPKQWLPADMPPDAFPARKEVAARVRFDAPGVAAAGYRVYAFYP